MEITKRWAPRKLGRKKIVLIVIVVVIVTIPVILLIDSGGGTKEFKFDDEILPEGVSTRGNAHFTDYKGHTGVLEYAKSQYTCTFTLESGFDCGPKYGEIHIDLGTPVEDGSCGFSWYCDEPVKYRHSFSLWDESGDEVGHFVNGDTPDYWYWWDGIKYRRVSQYLLRGWYDYKFSWTADTIEITIDGRVMGTYNLIEGSSAPVRIRFRNKSLEPDYLDDILVKWA
jgi:hypothetical protein